MALGDKIKKVINTINIKDHKEIFNENNLNVKTNADFKKYLKKKSQDLLKIVDNKITKYDFCLLLKQKLTNALGKNKEAIDSNLFNKYNTFPSQYHLVDLSENNYYNTYEQLKKEIIEKVKKYNKTKWVKAVPNKLKKQSTHLMGEAKLKSLSAKDENVLKKMAEENRLTLPDFRMVLKYKLENKYLGKKAADIYKKSPKMFCEELKTFYEEEFNKNGRSEQIDIIYNNYNNIVNLCGNGKIELNIETLSEKQDTTNNTIKEIRNKDSMKITGTYDDFKNQYIETFKHYSDFMKAAAQHQKARELYVNNIMKDNFANVDTLKKKEIQTKISELMSCDIVLKNITTIKQLQNLQKNDDELKYSFNMLKLIKYDSKPLANTDVSNMNSTLYVNIIPIFTMCTLQKTYEYYDNFINKEYYMSNITLNSINTLVNKKKKELEKTVAFQRLLEDIKKPAYLKPTRPLPPTPKKSVKSTSKGIKIGEHRKPKIGGHRMTQNSSIKK